MARHSDAVGVAVSRLGGVMSREVCPVCKRNVGVSWPNRIVATHCDKTLMTGCPMSGEQYPLSLYEEAS